MGSGGAAAEDGDARGVCAVPDQAGCDYEDSCDHSIWSHREVQEGFRAATGDTHSCALSNGFIDIMAEMQHEMAKEKGVMVEDEWGKEWELLTQLFADGAHHFASCTNCVKGLEERFEIATLWSAFFGMEHRTTIGRPSAMQW